MWEIGDVEDRVWTVTHRSVYTANNDAATSLTTPPRQVQDGLDINYSQDGEWGEEEEEVKTGKREEGEGERRGGDERVGRRERRRKMIRARGRRMERGDERERGG